MAFSADAGSITSNIYVEDLFSSYPYTGSGGSQSIINNIDMVTNDGLIWIKCRGDSTSHFLIDTVRGSNYFSTSNLSPQSSSTTLFSSFNSNGFTLTGNVNTTNKSAVTYASWAFRKSEKFFTIITYTGNGSVSRTINHDLRTIPGMIFIRKLSSTAVGGSPVWHKSLTAGDHLLMTATNASVSGGNNHFRSPAPTYNTFTIGSSSDVNQSGENYVAYIWGDDSSSSGVIQCGSFTTNGSGVATINLGWEPQYILTKVASTTGNWEILDTRRSWDLGTSNGILVPNLISSESPSARGNPSSTGASISGLSASQTYVYMTIRKGLMRTPTDATKVFAINASTGTGAARSITGVGFPPDLVISKKRSAAVKHNWQDRLRGTASQITSDSVATETTLTDVITSFNQDGVTFGADSTSGSVNSGGTYINYLMKQARGFHDIVRYVGTGSAHTESHNLGVAPELIILYPTNSGSLNWQVYYGVNTESLLLNTTGAKNTGVGTWNSTSPTSSVFSVGSAVASNQSGKAYIAYLFASASGVSKIGTYTGTGTTNSINCGFSAGARFVMIKRLDSTGDWYYWDTTRGLISGNDPYLLFNSTAAEVSGNDYIDPYSPGFELSSTAPAALNANGGSFLFWAIA